jgi:hypothetical protein
MLVKDPSKRGINPMRLSIQSGMNRGANLGRYRGWTYSGLAHGTGNGMGRGMGDISDIAALDPEPISGAILKIVGMVQSIFGGGGHLDANKITPVQNEVVATVIAPCSAYLTPGESTPDTSALTQRDLDVLQQALEKTQTVWLNFLHNTSWNDNRAATQAEATLAPYFSGLLGRIHTLRATAPTSIIQTITGSSDVTIPGADIPGTPHPSSVPSGAPSVLTAGFSTFMPVLLGLGLLFWFSNSRKKFM